MPWRGSVGFIDETGSFSLKTDLKTGRVEGAYVGSHKVIVQVPRTDGPGWKVRAVLPLHPVSTS